MHLADCPVPPPFASLLSTEPSPLTSAVSLACLQRSQSDDAFHSFKYRLAVLYCEIANILAFPTLPEYTVVMRLDAELRGIEATAPAWLRWANVGTVGKGVEEEIKARMIPQQHQAALLLHKAVLGES